MDETWENTPENVRRNINHDDMEDMEYETEISLLSGRARLVLHRISI